MIGPGHKGPFIGAFKTGLLIRAEGGGGNPFLFPQDGATDVWYFDMSSGDLVSEIVEDTYSANGTPTYEQSGPTGSGIVGVQCNADADYFTDPSLGSELNIGDSDSFVFMVQLKMDNDAGQPAVAYVVDFGGNGGGSIGMGMTIDETNMDFLVRDTTPLNHITRHAHGGSIWKDDTFYTIRYVFNRVNTKANLFIKEEGQAEAEVTTSAVINDFSDLAGVTFNGDGARWFAGEHTTSFGMRGTVYQAALAVGSTTYDVTDKP